MLLDHETRNEADLRWVALDPGQLVKDGFFTLFEAVGALEVRLPLFWTKGCDD